MTRTLHCYSFHSVKGGVGKSTLSTLLAHTFAAQQADTPVYLIDMDLTGTSLSDVLPLEAPRWPSETVELLHEPSDFWSCEETFARIDRRHEPGLADPRQVPYLNDYLLWADTDWSTDRDVLPSALAWRMRGAPANLRVIPSSAKPKDLQCIMPVIFDEEHAAFLEARIEALLDALVTRHERCVVVFDTPPTVPGLSHSILSLGFRLGGDTKIPLADDQYIPPRLRDVVLRWKIAMVVSPDRQDLVAAERWMALIDDTQRELVRLVVNRVPASAMLTIEQLFGEDLGPAGIAAPRYPTLANFDDRRFVVDSEGMKLFGHDELAIADMRALLDLAEWAS